MSLNQLREKIADRETQFAARIEFAKVGLDVDEIVNSKDDSATSLKGDRTKVRAALNQVISAARDSRAPTTPAEKALEDQRFAAIAWGSAVVAYCDQVLDLAEMGSAGGSQKASSKLYDSDNKHIGTLLSNEVLRDENRIAGELRINAGMESPSLTDFFRGVANMKTPERVRAALSEGTDSAGGYTVPTILLPGILNALVPASSMLRAGANVALLTDGAKSFNIAGINAIPTAAWRLESGAVAESDPAFRNISITPRSLAFRFKVSRELLADSPNLEQSLRIAIAQAFAKEIDRAGLRGSGDAPEIRGILNTTNVNAVGNGTNGAAITTYGNFISGMTAILTDEAPAPSAAIMHSTIYGKVAGLADTTGQPLARPNALASWQMIPTSQIPINLTVGSSTDCSEIFIGDFTQATFFMREGISVQLVTELYAATGEIGFICHTRLDLALIYPQAFAVVTGVRP